VALKALIGRKDSRMKTVVREATEIGEGGLWALDGSCCALSSAGIGVPG
jgi:hypothetical protein